LGKNKDEVRKLAKNTSVDLLEETKPLEEILKTCKQICKLLEISEESSAWFNLELNGYLIKYKSSKELYQNIPSYRRTSWVFYDIFGNIMTLPKDIMDLFGKSAIFHSIHELENNEQLIIRGEFLNKFNNFISEHGMDKFSKNLRIHEARISRDEITQILEGVKKRVQEFLDMVISLLEIE
jgi:hypothetical protein